jgi:hypothetical protein
MPKYEIREKWEIIRGDLPSLAPLSTFYTAGEAHTLVNLLNDAYEQGKADATVNVGAYEPAQVAEMAKTDPIATPAGE